MPFNRDSDYNINNFYDRYIKGEHVTYRNLNFKDNSVTDDWKVDDDYVFNNDICTFAGNKACFREGEQVVLNFDLENNKDWTAIELYKDGVIIDTIPITTDHVDNVMNHSVDLGTNLEYGDYKARVTNGDVKSDYTYFKVVQTNVSFTRSGNLVTCTFSSENAEPMAIRVVTSNGSIRVEHILSAKEVELGQATIEVTNLEGSYIKVYFESLFGRVTNNPILIVSGSGDDEDDD